MEKSSQLFIRDKSSLRAGSRVCPMRGHRELPPIELKPETVMNSSKLMRHICAGLFFASAAGAGAIDPPSRPGLYRGSITVLSTEYGTDRLPVKTKAKVIARVTEDSFGGIVAVIRANPDLRLDRPIPTFILRNEIAIGAYSLTQEYNNGSTIAHTVDVTGGPNKIVVVEEGSQSSQAGSVQSPFTVTIVLTRVGP
jgi:hypothetical protein